MKTSRILAVTAIAPIIWGTTYLVTSEILPPGRPFLAGVLRALPAGLILVAITRSLPRGVCTAYPRRSKLTADPAPGLASVEALYAARRLLGDDDPSLLDGYHWRAAFLAQFAHTEGPG